jgi:hypothetical protein
MQDLLYAKEQCYSLDRYFGDFAKPVFKLCFVIFLINQTRCTPHSVTSVSQNIIFDVRKRSMILVLGNIYVYLPRSFFIN